MDRFLEGRRILVLDDDFLLAQEVKDTVEDLGGTVIGPAGRVEQARALVREHAPDGAMLDVNIGTATSYELARDLLESGAAVVFLTGYETDSLDPAFRDVPRLSKPYDPEKGERLLREVFGSGAGPRT